jgi:hypothetical protein
MTTNGSAPMETRGYVAASNSRTAAYSAEPESRVVADVGVAARVMARLPVATSVVVTLGRVESMGQRLMDLNLGT